MTTTTNPVPIWRRVYRIGDTPDGTLWITAELNDQRNPQHGPELSVTGVTGPNHHGNASGGCGQNRDDLHRIHTYRDGWTPELVARLADIWNRWHLNGMRAGSPAQEQHLRDHPYNRDKHGPDHFRWARDTLTAAGLQPDTSHPTDNGLGYSYGTAWLYEELPADVLAWLRDELPTDDRHPWRDSNYTRTEATTTA